MRKIICDRCKKEITQATGIAGALIAASEAVKKWAWTATGKPTYEVFKNGEKADICPDCKKSFDDWLQAGEPVGNNRGTSGDKMGTNRGQTGDKSGTNRNTKIVVAAIEDPTEPGTVEFGDF